MDKKLKAKWVKALCSGEFKQGKEALKSANRYCCLGVARYAIPQISALTDHIANGWLEDEELDALGISNEVQRELAQVNDEGIPFEMIAGLIDSAL